MTATDTPPPAAEAPALGAHLADLHALGHDVAPVWAAQLDAASAHMASAIEALAARFAGIVTSLDGIVAASTGAAGRDELIASSQRRLAEVVATLEAAVAQRTAFFEGLLALRSVNDAMAAMTREVTAIGGQTRLLALNAKIEAARAGAAGLAFGVVAGELSQLASQSAAAGERIEERARQAAATIAATLDAAGGGAVDAGVAAAGATVAEVLDDLLGVLARSEDATAGLGRAAEAVRGEIGESLVALQFQDRVTQVLSHVTASIRTLPGRIDAALADPAHPGPLGADELLGDLAAAYTMVEEHLAHPGGSGAPADVDDVTFF